MQSIQIAIFVALICCFPIALHANEIGNDQNVLASEQVMQGDRLRLATIESPNEILFEIGILNKMSVSAFHSRLTLGYFQLQSSMNPISIYRLDEDKFRFSLLRSPFAGGSIIIPFMISFGSSEFLEFERKYGTTFFMPAYLLNPEINIVPVEYLRIYGGYAFDLVQDVRTRPIFLSSIGLKLSMKKSSNFLKIGYENTNFKGKNSGSIVIGLIIE